MKYVCGYLFLRFKNGWEFRQINPSPTLINLQCIPNCLACDKTWYERWKTRYEKRPKNSTKCAKKMVKCESWTENTKANICRKETRTIPWQSKMCRLAETVEHHATDGCMDESGLCSAFNHSWSYHRLQVVGVYVLDPSCTSPAHWSHPTGPNYK